MRTYDFAPLFRSTIGFDLESLKGSKFRGSRSAT
jgi:hypothetical protein